MATARLINMPAVAGLYAFIAGSLLFALLGRSPQVSVGADSTIAPVVAAGVATVAALGTPSYTHLVSFMALMVGVLVIAVGLLRLGWIAEFLSTPVITGVLAGIAIEILVRQLPVILGLAGGGTTTVSRVRKVAHQIGHTNGWSVGIAVVVFAVIVVGEKVDRRIPGALIGLVASILAVTLLDLKGHGVAVLGAIHGGLPTFAVRSASWRDFAKLAAPAFTVAFVCVAQTAATVRAGSAGAPATEDFNRDLVALGAGSVVAGLVGSFPVDSSPPRSAVVASAGGRSQLTSLIAAAVILGVVLVATGLLKDLPQATLGAILVFVSTRLFRVGDLRSILRFDRLEFGLAVVTLLAVAYFGIETGVVVAILLSLADRTRRTARPRDAILGREPGTDHWIPCDIGHPTEAVPGVIVYLLYAPVWYANADYVRLRVHEIIDAAGASGASPGAAAAGRATPSPAPGAPPASPPAPGAPPALGAPPAPSPAIHGFVFDADGISDIDFTGARTLGELAAELKKQKVALAIARSSHLVHHDLKHGGLLTHIGPEQLFDTVEDAVKAVSQSQT